MSPRTPAVTGRRTIQTPPGIQARPRARARAGGLALSRSACARVPNGGGRREEARGTCVASRCTTPPTWRARCVVVTRGRAWRFRNREARRNLGPKRGPSSSNRYDGFKTWQRAAFCSSVPSERTPSCLLALFTISVSESPSGNRSLSLRMIVSNETEASTRSFSRSRSASRSRAESRSASVAGSGTGFAQHHSAHVAGSSRAPSTSNARGSAVVLRHRRSRAARHLICACARGRVGRRGRIRWRRHVDVHFDVEHAPCAPRIPRRLPVFSLTCCICPSTEYEKRRVPRDGGARPERALDWPRSPRRIPTSQYRSRTPKPSPRGLRQVHGRAWLGRGGRSDGLRWRHVGLR